MTGTLVEANAAVTPNRSVQVMRNFFKWLQKSYYWLENSKHSNDHFQWPKNITYKFIKSHFL